MIIKKYILIIFLILITQKVVNAQTMGSNLVRNHSFEDYLYCPYNNGQLIFSKFWWGYSCDYRNSCDNMYCSVPFNSAGYQYAKTGVAYAHFVIYTSQIGPWKEYIKSRLQTKLVKNKRYCTELNISVADRCTENNSPIYLDSIGIYFSHDTILDTYTPLYGLKPQVNNSMIGIDTASWKAIKGSFVADGSEDFFAIGNYTDTVPWPAGVVGGLALFVDDVTVCECSFNFNLGADTTLCLWEKLLLTPNMPNATYTWQDSSHAATYEVKQPGTYWVRAYFSDYNITTTDTIVIAYKDCSTDLRIPDSFTPNGDGLNDVFEYFYAEYYDITTLIYNRWGELLFQSRNTDFWDGKYKGKTVHPGTYIYHIEAIRKATKEKKIHCGRITVI